jgi:AcrR family transcriptional regulator
MSKGPKKRIPRAEREERMLEAAEKVFSRGPYRDSSMEEIAKLSGITKPLLYKYFGSKEGLFGATADRVMSRAFTEIDEAARAVPPGLGRIEVFASGYVDLISESRGTWWLLYSDASPDAVNAMRRKNASVIAGILADSFAEQGVEVEHKQIDLLASTIVGAGEEMGRWWDSNPHISKEEVTRRFLTIINGAILAVGREAVESKPAADPGLTAGQGLSP